MSRGQSTELKHSLLLVRISRDAWCAPPRALLNVAGITDFPGRALGMWNRPFCYTDEGLSQYVFFEKGQHRIEDVTVTPPSASSSSIYTGPAGGRQIRRLSERCCYL